MTLNRETKFMKRLFDASFLCVGKAVIQVQCHCFIVLFVFSFYYIIVAVVVISSQFNVDQLLLILLLYLYICNVYGREYGREFTIIVLNFAFLTFKLSVNPLVTHDDS